MVRWQKWIRRVAATLGAVLIVGVLGMLTYQRISDGPTGPLTGGPFRTGEQVPAPIDSWDTLEGDFEFELVGARSSRTAGGILLDDALYITCDLGFIWNRLPAGTGRNILHIIWWFKTWHENAQLDGRIRIRKDGKIYPANIVLVTDLNNIQRLKRSMEDLAKEFFAPNQMGPRPKQEPNEVLFFRVTG